MITYRQAKFDDVENIHKLLNDYAKEGLMLPRSRNAIYENLRDYIVAVQGSHLVGCGALHFVWDRLSISLTNITVYGLRKNNFTIAITYFS